MAGFQGFHLFAVNRKRTFIAISDEILEPLVGLDIRKTCRWQAFKAFIFAVN
ncbi:MAG: hypothetical protein ACI3ZJ_09865 [Bacteroidaceae bacterium]